MGIKDYDKQKNSEKWKNRQIALINKKGNCCESCGKEMQPEYLSVHHKKYIKGRNYWDYSDNELLVLCKECHGLAHTYREPLKDLINYLDINALPMLYKVMMGFLVDLNKVSDGNLLNYRGMENSFEYKTGKVAALLIQKHAAGKIKNDDIPITH